MAEHVEGLTWRLLLLCEYGAVQGVHGVSCFHCYLQFMISRYPGMMDDSLLGCLLSGAGMVYCGVSCFSSAPHQGRKDVYDRGR